MFNLVKCNLTFEIYINIQLLFVVQSQSKNSIKDSGCL